MSHTNGQGVSKLGTRNKMTLEITYNDKDMIENY